MRPDFEPGDRPDPMRGLRRHLREHLQDHFDEHGPGFGSGFGPPDGVRERFRNARRAHGHGPHDQDGPQDHEGHDGPRGGGFGPRGGGPFPGGFGPGGFGPGGFGFGPPEAFRERLRGARHERGHGHGGHERGHGRGGRARRGNVRAAILTLLAEQPMHGYEMIKEISERSGGFWKPSPGSVYPTLQLLADEGLVSADEGTSGKRLYSLTDDGRAAAEKLDDTPPWDQETSGIDPNEADLRSAMGQLAAAAWQVSHAATSGQKARAVKAINEARSALYLILAEAGAEGDDEPEDVQDTED